MVHHKARKKDCFGLLDTVFPIGKEGLREIDPACFHCQDRKPCLQAALTTTKGLVFRSEVLDRTAATGLVGRLKRWSDRKALSRLVKQKEAKKK